MKSFRELLLEAKFSGFTPLEVEEFKKQIEDITKDKESLEELLSCANTWWKKEKRKSIQDKVEYGKVYFLVFDNPFNNPRQLTKEFGKNIRYEWPDPCEPKEEKTIYAIGVGDKFGNVHLATEWVNEDVVIYYNEEGLKLKHVKGDRKWVYRSKAGWYLKRKDYPCYLVGAQTNFMDNRAICFPIKQKPLLIKLDGFTMFDLTLMPKDLEAELEVVNKRKEEERKKKEEADKKKKEYEEWQIRTKANYDKFQKEIEGYEYLGFAMETTTQKAIKKYDGDWQEYIIGDNTVYYVNHKHKVYWRGYENYTLGTGSLD